MHTLSRTIFGGRSRAPLNLRLVNQWSTRSAEHEITNKNQQVTFNLRVFTHLVFLDCGTLLTTETSARPDVDFAAVKLSRTRSGVFKLSRQVAARPLTLLPVEQRPAENEWEKPSPGVFNFNKRQTVAGDCPIVEWVIRQLSNKSHRTMHLCVRSRYWQANSNLNKTM